MEPKVFRGVNESDIWQAIKADLAKDENTFQYRAVLEQGAKRVLLDIDIDPGGGFESGFATTRFSAPLNSTDDFRFSIEEEGLFADVGKLFGMQDVVIGYPEFDKEVIVKANNEEKVKQLFSDKAARQVWASLKNYSFGIAAFDEAEDEVTQTVLELEIEEGITDPDELQKIYAAFMSVLNQLQPGV